MPKGNLQTQLLNQNMTNYSDVSLYSFRLNIDSKVLSKDNNTKVEKQSDILTETVPWHKATNL